MTRLGVDEDLGPYERGELDAIVDRYAVRPVGTLAAADEVRLGPVAATVYLSFDHGRLGKTNEGGFRDEVFDGMIERGAPGTARSQAARALPPSRPVRSDGSRSR